MCRSLIIPVQKHPIIPNVSVAYSTSHLLPWTETNEKTSEVQDTAGNKEKAK